MVEQAVAPCYAFDVRSTFRHRVDSTRMAVSWLIPSAYAVRNKGHNLNSLPNKSRE
jgi:hypothetical protein